MGDGERAGDPVLSRLATQARVTVVVGGLALVAAVLLSGGWPTALGVAAGAVFAMLFWGLCMWQWLRGRVTRSVEQAPYVEGPALDEGSGTVRVVLLTTAFLVVGLAVSCGLSVLWGDDPRGAAITGPVAWTSVQARDRLVLVRA